MTISAWYMDSVDGDQRDPHKDSDQREVTKKDLDALGVLSWEGLTGVGKNRALLSSNYMIITCLYCQHIYLHHYHHYHHYHYHHYHNTL